MSADPAIELAAEQVCAVSRGELRAPLVKAFFDEASFTASYVVHDPVTKAAAIIDSVLDFDPAAGRTATHSAEAITAHVAAEGLTVEWILETHIHADHFSAAAFLQQAVGGQIAIGRGVVTVQQGFADLFNAGDASARDGSQFDRLVGDGDRLKVGGIPLIALHGPGHTPADMAYLIGDALFPGDTMFMPDYGSARCDFPGGDARQLFHSVRRLMRLPDTTRVFLCHDYKAPGRADYAWETTIGGQRAANVHLNDGVGEEDFVAMRTARDATLAVPKLILAAIQVNMRAGRLPDPEANGVRYLKLPLNQF